MALSEYKYKSCSLCRARSCFSFSFLSALSSGFTAARFFRGYMMENTKELSEPYLDRRLKKSFSPSCSIWETSEKVLP